jgi:hypothetical protein
MENIENMEINQNNINIDLEIDNNQDYDTLNHQLNLEWKTSDLNHNEHPYNNITFLDINDDEAENNPKINDIGEEIDDELNDELNCELLDKYLNQTKYKSGFKMKSYTSIENTDSNSDNNLEDDNNLYGLEYQEDEKDEKDEKELEDDLKLVKNLVEQQNKVRMMFFKKILMTYIKPYKYIDNGKLKNNIIHGIHNIATSMSIENYIGQQISGILFDYKILDNNQINNYKNILKPFLSTKESQFNFLNYILIILNKYNQLVEPDSIITIFEQLINYELVNDVNFIKWYNKKLNSRLCFKLNIHSSIIDAVYNFLDEFIINIQMN